MKNIKFVVVIRKDLKMKKSKMAGIASLATLKFLVENNNATQKSTEAQVEEQRVWWTDTLEWQQFMNGYLGPSPSAVRSAFNSIIDQARSQT